MSHTSQPDLHGVPLQDLISQVTPEQAAQLRNFIIDHLLQEKNFNINNPFFLALQHDNTEQFGILKNELIKKISLLPNTHPAKKLVFSSL